ncbi:unnamed protein product [Cladocopium goreaui]|uniref:Uncharacterized protein n=1 Tax=Cladocopium goreaui TaxID=2562237 RepID=A0A9P1FR98_9DINO|nr:unnamed protein product [Cladocopium goreaui]CAI3998370.1 unnamed protein product [Cladocopium goreaui]
MAGPEVLKAKRGKGAEKKKRVYGTFKKKHLCSKKRSNRRVESKALMCVEKYAGVKTIASAFRNLSGFSV